MLGFRDEWLPDPAKVAFSINTRLSNVQFLSVIIIKHYQQLNQSDWPKQADYMIVVTVIQPFGEKSQKEKKSSKYARIFI